MNWAVKMLGQKILDILPCDLGLKMHFFLQYKFGNVGRMNGNETLQTSITNTVKYLQEEGGFNFDGAKIMEVGTGWHGSDILLFYMLGSSEIYTCDLLRHLNETLVFKMLHTIGDRLNLISKECHIDTSALESRYSSVASCANLSELLTAANIKYLAPVKFHKLELPPSYFDLFYSHSVLQRVPLNDLTAYLEAGRRSLKPGGYSYHVIHHSDHNARHDDALGILNYLRFSDRIYDLMQSKRFNYQNRMRHLEFLQLFNGTGFRTIAEEIRSLDPEVICDLRLSLRFRSLPLNDILISRTRLISQVI